MKIRLCMNPRFSEMHGTHFCIQQFKTFIKRTTIWKSQKLGNVVLIVLSRFCMRIENDLKVIYFPCLLRHPE